jgi:hypothetical protein
MYYYCGNNNERYAMTEEFLVSIHKFCRTYPIKKLEIMQMIMQGEDSPYHKSFIMKGRKLFINIHTFWKCYEEIERTKE